MLTPSLETPGREKGLLLMLPSGRGGGRRSTYLISQPSAHSSLHTSEHTLENMGASVCIPCELNNTSLLLGLSGFSLMEPFMLEPKAAF